MERLKVLREAKGLNQQGLALKLNISQSSISYYETGERKPDLDTLIQLSDFFDVSIDYLVCRSDVKQSFIRDGQSTDDMNFWQDYLRLTQSQKEHVSAFMQGLVVGSKLPIS